MAEKELRTEIEINAPPEKVWQILTAFENFPQWNPFIRRIDGELSVGARLRVALQPPGGRSWTFKTKVLNVEPNREFRWLGKLILPGIFDGEHSFRIEPLDSGGVRFIQEENFKGILVAPFMKRIEAATKSSFNAMNKALKQRAEGELAGQ